MKLTILTFILCCCAFGAVAQTSYSIKGVTGDAASNVKLTGATVMVLNQKDSIMRAFTWAGSSGDFVIKNLPKGKFLIVLTYPGYADYVDEFTLDSVNTFQDFGYINMVLKTKLLKGVIIKGEVNAIKIKGDTLEYNAKAFKVQPNASVEDLIKQFPGFQVDKDGKITAHGKTVQKVLVDGEEFFGDDPTLVTRNLRADMVDKAQLYEKKSDQAAFTGIDDGKTTTTLNLKLKQDKKNGLFGKVNGNIGTDDYYEGQVQVNRFKANEKYSVYGTAANDGRTGLDYGDASQLGVGNDNVQFGDDGSMMFFSGGGDQLDSFGGYYNGQGKPVTSSAGAHYDSKWDSDKESINGNYKIGQIDVVGTTVSTTQQSLPGGINTVNSNQNFNDFAFRQKLDLTYQIKLDTANTLKFIVSGTEKTFHVINDQSTKTDSAGVALNDESRNVDNHGNEYMFNASALYTKKFKKVGRTLSWLITEAYDDKKTNGILNSVTDYYQNGKIDSTVAINQYKPTNTITQTLHSNVTYSEPITKRLSILFNYGLSVNNASSNDLSYDQSSPGVYDIFDQEYSNDYKFNQLDNQIGAIFNYKYKKAVFNIGTRVSDDSYKQVDEYTDNVMSRNFINWYPQAMFQYRPGPQTILMINYNGSTQQPSLQQLQPLLTNTDPLNVTLGNPDLKPSFRNNIYGWYSDYKIISGFNFNVNFGYNNTINPIVNYTTTSAGKNTTQYVNLHGETPYSYYSYIDLGQKITPIDTYIGIRGNASANISYSYSESLLDEGDSHSYGGSLVLQKYKEKKYDFSISGGPSYTLSSMSLQPGVNNNAAGFNANGYANVYLPLKFGAGSDVNYNYTAKTEAFSAQYKTIWNAYIFKTFLKEDKLKISASVNDLLDQNTNFTRGVYGNTTTQTNTTGIRRFFMLSVVWNFTKFNTTKSQDDSSQDTKAK
jgi:hypothetical protein